MLGPRIAALRRRAGLSQSELALRLNISPSTVGMYEQGRREPSGETLVAIAQEFGVTTDFLLTGKSRSPDEDTVRKELLVRGLLRADGSALTRQELALLLAAMLTD